MYFNFNIVFTEQSYCRFLKDIFRIIEIIKSLNVIHLLFTQDVYQISKLTSIADS